ncbi:hypothetical protein [Amaricoccus solimangrovi]|uniref:Right handed beta helix domain-containing protein n=1 Tax=Amaricoccus solimangrovi TaxID=2589815 RepID=A0A501WBF3_9RHOB|nr:hypothetical protein [Amaricoccus solimangrovi]TPE44147.1 hypothetical protein FJM51_23140 [Amaricoccus solimangrovi]
MENPASPGGVTLEGAKNCVVEANVMRRPPNTGSLTGSGSTDNPGIAVLSNKFDNVIFRNNVCPRAGLFRAGEVSSGALPGVTLTGNKFSDNTSFPSGWESLVATGSGRNVGQWAPA